MSYRTADALPVPRRRLAPDASGLRHLRWSREVFGTLLAHHEHDARLDAEGRELVIHRATELRVAIDALSAAVKPYRDFLERTRTRMRGMLRVGDYLVAQARTRESEADATAVRDGLREAFTNFEAREREPLRAEVRRATRVLRAHLEAMDVALEQRLGAAFVESLYPELDDDAKRIVDDGDVDDDATT